MKSRILLGVGVVVAACSARGGVLEKSGDEWRIGYDFSNGGKDVPADYPLKGGTVCRELSFEVNVEDSAELAVQFVDSSGQSFTRLAVHASDGWAKVVLEPESGNFSVRGGAGDGVLHQPLARLSFVVRNAAWEGGRGGKGTVRIRQVDLREKTSFEREEESVVRRPLDENKREARRLKKALENVLPHLEKRGLGAKTRATLAVMESFGPWIAADLSRGLTNRAERETAELVTIAQDELARLRRVQMGLESERPVPRYVTSPVVVSNGDMIAEREWPDGRRERGRVMLSGFGHFRRVQDELDRLPAFGNNVIQVEIGPRHVLKTEEEVDTGRIDHFLGMARRAASNDVQICLLLSPHYFPEWALKKYPDLRSCTDRGFLKYCVHNRRAQEVVERFLRVIIPKVRGNPAIHSIVLSNEPEQGAFGPKCALRPEWPKYLARKFGSVERMNATWKTAYGTFESVPVPRYCQPTQRNRETLEFIRFSRLEFAEFHRRMADVVREMASEIPLHVKQKGCDQYRNGQTFWSVDPELFGELSDYNGCDLVDWPVTSDGWAHADWWCLESACDYMRSCCDKPIFNSEIHVLFDRGRLHVPGRHVYSALWQSAVHGQTATTAWLWERTDNPRHEFYGLFLDRPECLNAWAHGSLDLSRLADELAPIRNQPPTVLLHFSLASQVLSGRRGRNFLTTYRAASFLGQPLGVVTERMLVEYGKGGAARRPLDSAHVVLLPDDDFIEPDVRAGLDRLAARGVRIVSCSGTDRDQFERFSGERSSWRLPDCPHVCAIDGKAGVFGVESRGYVQGEKRRLSLVNHLRGPVSVRLEGEGRDLISGASVPRCVTLESQKPLFIEMPKRNE